MEEHQKRFVLAMLGYAAQRDISVEQLCKRSNLDLKKLKEGSHSPITPKQLNDLWLNASDLGNDALFGLHFGESLQLSALGIVGEIIKTSRTVGEALMQGASLVHLFTDLFTMEISRKRTTFIMYVNPTQTEDDPSFTFSQTRDLLMMFIIHELDGLLLKKIKPIHAKLSFPQEHAQEYERVLRCKPLKSKEYSLEFPISYWNEPILTANYELQHILLQKATPQHTKSKRPDLSERIRSYLMSMAYLGILTLEEVAANFNMSPRSVQRKLKEEGTSFQQLADTVRKTLAQHYLRSGDYQVKEVSAILGYNEMSAFSRAFKRWTGKSPQAYQA